MPSPARTLLAAAALLCVSALGTATAQAPAHELRFALDEAGAGPLTQDDVRDRFVLVYFGYTRCPDICPGDLARLAAALRSLDAIAGRLVALFVDVDPRPYPPGHLADYVRHFHPGLRALDGPPDAVRAAAASLGARVRAREADGETLIDHSSEVFLVGRDGRLLAELPRWMPPRDLVAAIAWFTIAPEELARGAPAAGTGDPPRAGVEGKPCANPERRRPGAGARPSTGW